MPVNDTALLLLCAGLTVLGVLLTGLAWRRGARGRAVQGVGFTLAPVALYLSGLLRLLWNAAVALGRWATAVVMSPLVWVGLALLALSVVLFVIGGLTAKRRGDRRERPARRGKRAAVSSAPTSERVDRPAAAGPKAAPDDDMAEIEALLKSRGIE